LEKYTKNDNLFTIKNIVFSKHWAYQNLFPKTMYKWVHRSVKQIDTFMFVFFEFKKEFNKVE